MNPVKVLAIDGPTASGKGTVATRVAEALGWNLLDSGSIYRMVALAAIKRGIGLNDETALIPVAEQLDASFNHGRIILEGEDVSVVVRKEETGNAASKLAALPGVRAALLERQRAFREVPGLVADGRDMASIVFPDAFLKIFMTASAEARAERRYKQLIEKGLSANIDSLVLELRERDLRDASRPVAPLKQGPDSVLLDTTQMGIDEAVQFVLDRAHERLAGKTGN
ncbi:(d)CMP kinase [Uliginosibacterium sp. H1]|uniref:(d)CMP kinase n=1 Tax=Uliginosibacterium sp. H1 TaxID=3114757 RepID=UPI002E18AF5B|nr:(d)CMP kinase [Uliginosibacterium sp. H1]